MTNSERLIKLATATPAVLAKVDAVLNGTDTTTRAPDPDCRLVTFTRAAKLAHLSRPTIYRLVKSGRLHVVPLNGVNRIVYSSLVDLISK